MTTAHFHTLRVSDVRRETPDCVSVAFEVPEEYREDYAFTQGQHLTLRREIDGEDVRRSYSICVGKDDGEIRVAVKKLAGGTFSTYVNEELKKGDELEVMPPQGRFFTPIAVENDKHYLALVAGSGTTLKHFHLRGGEVSLEAANPNYEPITLPAEEVTVQGQLVAVWRQV